MTVERPVVLVNHLLEPPNTVTGVSRFVFSLLRELARSDKFEYVLLTTWSQGEIPRGLIESGVRVVKLPFYKSLPLNVLMQMRVLPELIEEFEGALEFNCNPIGGVRPAWPRVTTVHDLYFDLIPNAYSFRHRLWWRWLFPLSLAGSAQVVCVSEATRSDLKRYYPRFWNKSVVVHEAGAILRESRGEERGVVPSVPYALYVGNISPNKGPGVLASALRILQNKAIKVYHVGSDNRRLLAEALMEAGVSESVQMLRGVSDAQLVQLYRSASCLVVTSVHEGFCLPIVEAQSEGAPVVCSDIPVFREVAGQGALFFAPDDPQALAACLDRVLCDERLRKELSSAGRTNAGRFSWARAAKEMEDVFRKVIIERKRGSTAAARARQRSIAFGE